VQLYGTLTGMFWVLIYFTNVVVLFRPAIITPRYTRFNRPTEAFLESLNPKYRRIIQLEALAVIVMHAAMIYFWKIPIFHYLAVMFGFGFVWSAMQYAHHYGTVREVQKGAMNLKTFGVLDRVWLNHNWHLNHHMSPTVPWVYLPALSEEDESRGSLVKAYCANGGGRSFPTNTWRIAMQAKSSSKGVRPPAAEAFPAYPASWYLFCASGQLKDKPFSQRILGRQLWLIEKRAGKSP